MSAVLPRPPAGLSDIHIETLRAGYALHRNHDAAFAATAFNPGQGQPARFSPFATTSTGLVVPTLYAAASREAAVHETLFHDIEAADPLKTIRRAVIDARIASTIAPRRSLRLATLFTQDLMRWGVTRSQLIDTPKTAYAETVLWAQAIHASDLSIDGLTCMSRRCDSDRCVILFGDRLASTDLEVVNSLAVASDDLLTAELRRYARRAGIAIIP